MTDLRQKRPLTIITIPKEKMDQYTKRFWGSAENIFVATEVQQIKSGGNKETRTLFITTAAIYVFKNKSFSGVELSHHFTVIDLTKVSYIEPDTLIIGFGTKEVVFRTDPGSNALNIGTLLLMQHACNFFQVPNITKLRVESSPQDALVYVECPVRPKNALQTRLVTVSHYYRKPFPQANIKMYSEWDQTHTGNFVIDDKFNTKDAAVAIAHAIAWDSDIKSLVLRKFAAPQIGKVLEKFFEESFTIQRILIEGYSQEWTEAIKLQAREETSINSLAFKDCHPTLVIRVIRGLAKFDGRLRSLQVINCNLSKNDWGEVFAAIQKFPCFMKLTQLALEELKLATFPTNLLCQTLTKSRFFNNVSITRCNDDLSGFVSTIFDEAKSISHLEMEHCKFLSPLKVKNTNPKFTFLDLSYSYLTTSFFKSFMEVTLTRKGARPFVLDLSAIQQPKFEELFAQIENIELLPNLVEFLFNGNPLPAKVVPTFLKFLTTQKQSLQYVSLIASITNVTNVFLPPFLDILKNSSITGFDISPQVPGKNKEDYYQFLQSLKEVKTLKSLALVNSGLGDAGMDLIMSLVKENTNVEDVNVDLIGISSQDKFCEYYNALVKVDNIRAVGNPRKEMTKLGITKEKLTEKTRATLMLLKKTRLPPTQQQRLAKYEKVEYDDNGSDLENGEMRTKTNPLDELESVQKALFNSICQVEASELSPEETARLIMENITTSSSSLSKDTTGSHKKIGSIFRT